MDDKTKLASCQEESEVIQFANDLYLKHDKHSPAATAEYLLRLGRLEEVRKDVKDLARAITVQN
jgi:hypothetical protein